MCWERKERQTKNQFLSSEAHDRISLLFQFQDFSSSSSTVWWRKMSGNSGGFTSASDVSDLKNILVWQPHILRADLTLSVRRKTNLGWFMSPVCVLLSSRGEQLCICWSHGQTQTDSSTSISTIGPLGQVELHRQHVSILRLQPERLDLQETKPGWGDDA